MTDKYDHEDRSFADIRARCARCYEPEKTEQENAEFIEDLLTQNKYTDKHMVEVHLEHLDTVLNRLQNIRMQERDVCPSNADLDAFLAKLQSLSRRLAEMLNEF